MRERENFGKTEKQGKNERIALLIIRKSLGNGKIARVVSSVVASF